MNRKEDKKCPRIHNKIVEDIVKHDKYNSLKDTVRLCVEGLQLFGRCNNGDGPFLRDVWNYLYKNEPLPSFY